MSSSWYLEDDFELMISSAVGPILMLPFTTYTKVTFANNCNFWEVSSFYREELMVLSSNSWLVKWVWYYCVPTPTCSLIQCWVALHCRSLHSTHGWKEKDMILILPEWVEGHDITWGFHQLTVIRMMGLGFKKIISEIMPKEPILYRIFCTS